MFNKESLFKDQEVEIATNSQKPLEKDLSEDEMIKRIKEKMAAELLKLREEQKQREEKRQELLKQAKDKDRLGKVFANERAKEAKALIDLTKYSSYKDYRKYNEDIKKLKEQDNNQN